MVAVGVWMKGGRPWMKASPGAIWNRVSSSGYIKLLEYGYTRFAFMNSSTGGVFGGFLSYFPPRLYQVLIHAVLGKHEEGDPAGQPPPGQVPHLLEGIRAFLTRNGEMRKMLSRQCLVDLRDLSLEAETSLEGLFGVRIWAEDCLLDTRAILWDSPAEPDSDLKRPAWMRRK